MTIPHGDVTVQLESLAKTLGVFDRVNLHEPVSAPSTGITCAIWNQAGNPVPRRTGGNSTTFRFLYLIRLFHVLRIENPDVVDERMIDATSQIMTALSGDFDLGQAEWEIDLLGAYGEPLSYQAGFIEYEDGPNFRAITITVPLIVNDVFSQVR
jgi:hypothetical protein